MSKFVIVYHKDCMDGIGAAFICDEAVGEMDTVLVPLQYSKESELDSIEMDKDTVVYFVDFSLKRDKMIELAAKVKEIKVYDHHKTAQAELVNLPMNVEVHFTMSKSGVGICLEHFKSDYDKRDKMFEYIQDRDLWKWELPYSKNVSAFLSTVVKPNDIESFRCAYQYFDLDQACDVGAYLVKYQNNQVTSKVSKVKDVLIQGIQFKALNVTENISEVGNAICEKYQQPALMYFITQDLKVMCSLRSTDKLPDVSVIATQFAGGGHRNSCGFTIDLDDLYRLLQGNF